MACIVKIINSSFIRQNLSEKGHVLFVFIERGKKVNVLMRLIGCRAQYNEKKKKKCIF